MISGHHWQRRINARARWISGTAQSFPFVGSFVRSFGDAITRWTDECCRLKRRKWFGWYKCNPGQNWGDKSCQTVLGEKRERCSSATFFVNYLYTYISSLIPVVKKLKLSLWTQMKILLLPYTLQIWSFSLQLLRTVLRLTVRRRPFRSEGETSRLPSLPLLLEDDGCGVIPQFLSEGHLPNLWYSESREGGLRLRLPSQPQHIVHTDLSPPTFSNHLRK